MRAAAALLLALLPAAVSAQGLSDRLAAALALPPSATVELDNPRLDTAEAVAVENVVLDPRTSRLVATVDGARITARVRRTIELPVLTRYVQPGETIGEDDVAFVTIRADRLGHGVAGEAESLVGKTPKRPVRPGEPVRLADIRAHAVVKKSELVTILVENGALRLTAQGKVSEDGALGAPVRVSNTRSGKTLDAVVVGPGLVKIEVQ